MHIVDGAPDFFDKCNHFVDMATRAKGRDHVYAAKLYSAISPPVNAGPYMVCDGRQTLQFSTNDYLGLAMHPEVRQAATVALEQYGHCSPMGSRLLTGNTELHLRLEERIAAFKRCEASLVFANGAMAMMGMLAALAQPRDLLLLDEYAHASLVCGAKISGAEVVVFRHNDMEHLESILERQAVSRPAAIVVDGVYSMQGDIAPLDELVVLKRRYGVRLIVDDAHGTGVFGEHGRGTAAHFGVEREVDVHAGTFSKSLGTIGGFVAGSRNMIEYLRYHAPTFLFTKAMPLVVTAATLAALKLLEKADTQRETLWRNTHRLQDGLRSRGFDLGGTRSPITPIQFRGNDALRLAYELRSTHGVWVAPVMYPAVPLGRSILRVIPTALHEEAHIDRLVQGLAETRCSMLLGSLAAA